MFCRVLVLSLLLVSLGSRPAVAAIITITGQTPWVVPNSVSGAEHFKLGEAVFGDALWVQVSGGIPYFEIGGSVATMYTTDTRSMWLRSWMGSTLLSANVVANIPFFVGTGSTSYAPGAYTFDLPDLAAIFSFGPGFPDYMGPDRWLTVVTVTVDTPDQAAQALAAAPVPEPAVSLLMLGGMWAALAWSRRTRG